MGHVQSATCLYGLPVCNRFISGLPLGLQQNVMRFPGMKQGGFFIASPPMICESRSLLGDDIFQTDTECHFYKVHIGTFQDIPHNSQKIQNIIKTLQMNTSIQRVIFDVDKTQKDCPFVKFTNNVFVVPEKDVPLKDFIGYYLIGHMDYPRNVSQYKNQQEWLNLLKKYDEMK